MAGPEPIPEVVLHCPLCGNSFTKGSALCHQGCPLHEHCHVVCCPNCGYTVTDTSGMEEGLKRFRRKASSLLRALDPARIRKGRKE